MISATTQAAAESVRSQMPRLRLMVLQFLRREHGATREEIAYELALLLATVCGRVNELLNRPRKTGKSRYPWPPLVVERGTRPTRSGHSAAVLFLTDEGRAFLAGLSR